MNPSQEKEESWFFGDGAAAPKRVESPAVRGSLDVVIGAKCFISGALRLEGKCLIDGTVEGEVNSSGELVIGERAAVKARITGETVRVHGKVIGDIECSKKLELRSGAVVQGNISSPSITIEDGVSFQGFCSMIERPVVESEARIEVQSTRAPVEQAAPVVELTAVESPLQAG